MTTVVKSLMNTLFAWFISQLENEALNTLVNTMISKEFQLFEQNIVEDIIDLFSYVGLSLLVIGILFAVVDLALSQMDGNKKDFGWFFKNIFFSIIVCFLLKEISIELFQFGNTLLGQLMQSILTGTYGINNGYISVSLIISTLGDFGVFLNVIVAIIYLYNIFKIFLSLYKRSAFFIIHLCIGFFHMFALPSGRWDGFFSWCRLAMGLIVGNILQVSTYFLGLTVYTTISVHEPAMSVIVCLAFMSASAEVDKLLIFFGIHGSGSSIGAYGNSIKSSASSIVKTTSKVVNIVK